MSGDDGLFVNLFAEEREEVGCLAVCEFCCCRCLCRRLLAHVEGREVEGFA